MTGTDLAHDRAEAEGGRFDALVELLSHGGWHLRRHAADALAELATHPAPHTRLNATQLLGRSSGGGALARLIALAEDPDANVRSSAIEALGHLSHPGALWPLVRHLRSGDPHRAFPALGALADLTTDPTTGAAARHALGRLAGRAPALAGRLLAKPSPTRRLAAVGALARASTPGAGQLLLDAIGDADPGVAAAVQAVGDAGTFGFRDRVGTLAKHTRDPVVRMACDQALGRG